MTTLRRGIPAGEACRDALCRLLIRAPLTAAAILTVCVQVAWCGPTGESARERLGRQVSAQIARGALDTVWRVFESSLQMQMRLAEQVAADLADKLETRRQDFLTRIGGMDLPLDEQLTRLKKQLEAEKQKGSGP